MEANPELVARFNRSSSFRPGEDCWEFTGKILNGYGRLWTGRGCKPQTIPAHRFSYELFRGPVAKGLCVCHHCDNPKCVNPSHLFLGTHADNIRDRDKKGRHVNWSKGRRLAYMTGTKHWKARLTEQDVYSIRALAKDGVTQRELANKFGVSICNINNIVLGKLWRHLLWTE